MYMGIIYVHIRNGMYTRKRKRNIKEEVYIAETL